MLDYKIMSWDTLLTITFDWNDISSFQELSRRLATSIPQGIFRKLDEEEERLRIVEPKNQMFQNSYVRGTETMNNNKNIKLRNKAIHC